MKKYIVLAIIAALASASYAASSSEGSSTSLSEGTQEIVVSGLFDPEAVGDTQLTLGAKYGQFIQDNVEVGVAGGLSQNDLIDSYDLGVFGEYNWDLGTEVVPFVGAGIGYRSVDLDDGGSSDAFVLRGEGGVKYFLAQNVAVSGSVEYDWASDEVYIEDDQPSEDNVQLNLAMRFYIP